MRVRQPCLALPDGVRWEDLYFEPTWEEKAIAYHLRELAKAKQAVRELSLIEQREWLAAQTQRLAAIALELDATERHLQMVDEMEKREQWWRETVAREAADNKRLTEIFQAALDAPARKLYEQQLARVEAAGRDIARTAARLERKELKRRGVIRGQRIETAVMPMEDVEYAVTR